MAARTGQHAESIFFQAVEIADGAARERFLAGACADDAELRCELDQLIANHFGAGQFLERPAMEAPRAPRADDNIGSYRLLEQIGEGGMGDVYLAEQHAPVRRKVALKVIKPGMDSRQVLARFEAERQALALMEHPNIARVLEGGETDAGRPYFVMELVRGMPITDYCDQRRLRLADRMQLFLDVCRAVQHAHVKGIIHRDLKPSNILVSECDGQPLVKVIDFGVAKAIGQQQLTEKTLFTGMAQLVGTPAYMSPEQAALSAVDVDTRSDVYSLGVLLYELLTGVGPFDAEALQSAGYDGMRRMIQEVDPLRPSARLSSLTLEALTTLSENRQLEPAAIRRHLNGDLDWIVMKALDKQRSRRYQSAALMADDVTAFLRHDAVTARPPTMAYLLRKFAGKHRIALATAGAVAAALVIGLGLTLWQAREAFRAKQLADSHLVSEQRARAEALSRATRLRREIYAGDMADAWQAWNDGVPARAKIILARYAPAEGAEDLREFAWHFLNAHCNYQPELLGSHDAPILAAALSRDGMKLASSDRGGNVIVWDVAGRQQIAAWNYSQQEVTAVAFAPSGRLLATAGQDRTIRLWDADDWTERAVLRGHAATVCSVSWSPDGQRLASAARDNSIRIWDVATQREEKVLSENEDVVRCVHWLADGSHLVAAVGGAVRQWSTADWKFAGELARHAGGILAIAVSRDGRYLASGGYSADVLITDLRTQRVVTQASSITKVWSLSFSPDGRFLAGGLQAAGPSFWRLRAPPQSAELVRVGLESGGPQRAALFDSTGDAVVLASEASRQIKLWDSAKTFGRSVFSFPESCHAVADVQQWAVGADDGVAVIRRLPGGEPIAKLRGHRASIDEAVPSPSGGLLATHSLDGEVLLWDLKGFQLLRRLTLDPSSEGAEVRLVFSPDEQTLAAAANTGGVRLWTLPSGDVLRDLEFSIEDVARIAFAPDSTAFATAVAERGGTIWNIRGDAQLGAFGHERVVWDLCYSPDGARLYGAAGLNGVVGWNARSGRELFRLAGHRGHVDLVAVSPDGQTLATSATDNAVRLWHIPTGRPLFTLTNNSGHAEWLRFSSPRKLLVGARPEPDAPIAVYVFSAEDSATP